MSNGLLAEKLLFLAGHFFLLAKVTVTSEILRFPVTLQIRWWELIAFLWLGSHTVWGC